MSAVLASAWRGWTDLLVYREEMVAIWSSRVPMSLASSRAVIGRFIGVAGGGEAKEGAVEEGVGGI